MRIKHVGVVVGRPGVGQVLSGSHVVRGQEQVKREKKTGIGEAREGDNDEKKRHRGLSRSLGKMVHIQVDGAVVEEAHEREHGKHGARGHDAREKPQEVAVVSRADAVVEKQAVVVVNQHTAVAHAAVAHAGQAPDVARGAVLDGDAVLLVGVVGKRDLVEVLLRRLVGAEVVHRYREMEVAGLEARVGGAALDEEQKQKEPQVREHHHGRRAYMVPDPAGLEHPKEHAARHDGHSHGHAHGLALADTEPSAKAVHVVHVLMVLHLVVSEPAGGGGVVGVGH